MTLGNYLIGVIIVTTLFVTTHIVLNELNDWYIKFIDDLDAFEKGGSWIVAFFVVFLWPGTLPALIIIGLLVLLYIHYRKFLLSMITRFKSNKNKENTP